MHPAKVHFSHAWTKSLKARSFLPPKCITYLSFPFFTHRVEDMQAQFSHSTLISFSFKLVCLAVCCQTGC